MGSPVFFVPVSASASLEELGAALGRLLEKSRVWDWVAAGMEVAIKLHFGEEGNAGYVRPELLRVVAERLRGWGAASFLSDTNTLYQGRRTRCADHLRLAQEHGFTLVNAGAEVRIPDDTKPENVLSVRLDGRYIKTAKIANIYADAGAFVGVAHFKGHIMTGFGGALKNVGMGCAVREGKLAQHSDVSPVVVAKDCIACGDCVPACPVGAIRMLDKARVEGDKCIGCASCLAACRTGALQVDWALGGDTIQEKMAEYAKAVLGFHEGKAAFLNFCVKITAKCDCLAKAGPRIAPDVGILASRDPVALDQASLDLTRQAAGSDVFRKAHSARDGDKQLRHAEALGLGQREYEIMEV